MVSFFLILIVVAPFTWVFIRNYLFLFTDGRVPRLFRPTGSTFITEVNTLQTRSRQSGLGAMGRLWVNKYSLYAKEVASRYLESFDLGFLFFTGDLNSYKSTHENGPLLISFVPLIIVGLIWCARNKYYWILLLLGLTAIPGALVEQHYESTVRLPLLLVLIFLAAVGLSHLFRNKRKYGYGLSLLVLADFLRFWHFFVNHYRSGV